MRSHIHIPNALILESPIWLIDSDRSHFLRAIVNSVAPRLLIIAWKTQPLSLIVYYNVVIWWNYTEIRIDIGSNVDQYFVFSLIFTIFLDVDECRTSNDVCHEDAACDNTEGSFTCTCQSGYSGDGLNCVGGFARVKTMTRKFEIQLLYEVSVGNKGWYRQ